MLKNKLILFLFTVLFAVLLTPWFTNNRNVIVSNEVGNNFQKDAEVLVVSRIAAEVSGVNTKFYNLGRLGPETKTKLNTWGNPDPYQALDEKSARDFQPYVSQYGIHSGIYSLLYPKIISLTKNVFNLTDLRYVVTYLFVLINLFIFITIYKNIDKLLASIWILSIIFAPFVLLFARNIYWSTFSFYLPILFSILFSVTERHKKLFLLITNLALLFRFLMGYEFFTTLIITCSLFSYIGIFLKNEFNFSKIFLKTYSKIVLSFFATFILAINIHSILSPQGYRTNMTYLLTRSNARLANSESPVSSIVSTLESYFLEWPKFFGWPVWYSENNLFSFPLPTLNLVSIPGKFLMIVFIFLMLLFLTSLVSGKVVENKLHLLIFLLGPISWIVLYPNHENEHGFDFFLMYFGAIQIIVYIIFWNFRKLFYSIYKSLNQL